MVVQTVARMGQKDNSASGKRRRGKTNASTPLKKI